MFKAVLDLLPSRAEKRGSLKDGAVANPSAQTSVESIWIQQLLSGLQSSSGMHVTPLRAMGVATVFACVNKLASTISTLPLSLYRRTPDGNKIPAHDHPLHDILHMSPNERMTSVDFRLAMEGHRALRGNAYAVINRNDRGEVISIMPVLPEDVQDSNGYTYQFSGETYDYTRVIHLNGITRDGIFGMDILRTVHDVLGLAIALDENASKFFRNGSRPGGVLEHPGRLSEAAYARLRKDMEGRHAGVENAYRMMILEEGLKFQNSRSDNTDSQFDESRARQDKAIARIFGVPPHKLALVDSMPRANVEQENLSWVVDTIRPICVAWEQQLNLKLLSKEERRTHYIKFNLQGLLRGDMKTRYDSYALGRQWGWLSVNEIRRLEDLNDIGDDGDVYLQPLNMVPLGAPPADET